MKNTLNLFNNILFLKLRPWIFGKQNDYKFKKLLLTIKKEYYKNQPKYEVVYIKPLSNVLKFYYLTIEYETINFLNNFHNKTTKANNKNEISYYVHIVLLKSLPDKINEIKKNISHRKYTTEQIEFTTLHKTNINSAVNESYIFHLLKHHTVRLILEIQESYSEFLNSEPLTIDEIYNKYFNESPPEKSFIIEAGEYPSTIKPTQTSPTKSIQLFNVILDDIRKPINGIYNYSQLIKNPSRFSKVEEDMFQYELINNDYEFKNKYGQKQYLAALYFQLIKKGYFFDRIFPGNIEIKPLFIRKFLDYRYNTNTDKQFRNWNNNQEKLSVFIEKDYCLDHIQFA